MQVTGEILDAFATAITTYEKRKLSGFEVSGDQTIGIDDADQTYLDILYIDKNVNVLKLPENAEELRSTLVTPKRHPEGPVGAYGYLFKGLIKPLELKSWYIETFKPKGLPNENNG